MRIGAILLATLLGSLGLAQTNMCTTAGGTRSSNLFALDGTFGTAPGTTQNPTLTDATNTVPTVQPTRYALSTVPGITSGVDSSGRPIGSTTYTQNTRTAVNFAGNYSPEDGEYEITNSSYNRQDGAWHRFIGGRNGGGPTDLFMLINAALAAGVFYQQTLTVSPNTNYEFSISVINIIANGSSTLPNINLEIDRSGVDDNNNGTIDEAGESQVIALTGDIANSSTPIWKEYGGVINSGASNRITVRFRNNAPGGGGNDLAIDNLQFTSCTGLSTGNISGKLYLDSNTNNSYDSGEPTVGANTAVSLIGKDSNLNDIVVATAQTDSSGNYSFVGVPAGTYTIGVPSADPHLNNAVAQSPSATSTINSVSYVVRTSVSLSVGGNLTNQNFGFVLPLTASKTDSRTSASVGNTITYTITVKNTTSAALSNVRFYDPLPTGLTYVSGSATVQIGTGSTSTISGSYPFGTSGASSAYRITNSLAAGVTATLTYQATVNASPPNTVSNQATLYYTQSTARTVLTDDPDVSGLADATLTPIGANLTMTKVASVSSVSPGSSFTYTLTITNNGGATANSIRLYDPLPSGLSYVANSYTLNGVNQSQASYPFGGSSPGATLSTSSLAVGSSLTVAFQVQFTSTPASLSPSFPTSLSNQATTTYRSGSSTTDLSTLSDDPAISGSSDPTISSVLYPDLSISKTHSGNFNIGSTGSYTITVSNASGVGSTAGTVTVSDVLRLSSSDATAPTGISLTGLSGTGWTCTVGTGSCTRSDVLTAGSSYPAITATVSVAASSTTSASFVNRATVSNATESTTSNNTADDTTLVVFPDFSITKTQTSTLNVGGSATYSLVVANAAGAASSSGTVTVTDTLRTSSTNATAPTGISISAISGTGWSCTLATATCTRSDALAAGASYPAITVTVAATSTPSSTFTNRGVVSGGAEASATNANNTNDVNTTVAFPSLSIAKSHTGSFSLGSTGDYSFTVSNSGAGATSGTITFSDTLPTGLIVNGGASGTVTPGGTNAANWSCSSDALNPQTITCTSSTVIAASGSSTFSLTVNVGGSTAVGTNSITNTAKIYGGSDPSRSTLATAASVSDPTSVARVADLAISKTNGVSSVISGNSTTYTIRVTNNGPSSVTGAILSDPAVTGLSKSSVACSSTPGQCSTAPTVTQLQAGTFALPALTSGQFYEITVVASVSATSGNVTNTATIAVPSGASDPISSNNSASDTDTVLLSADLAITKTNSVSSINAGSSTTYTIRVTNNGPSSVTGAILTDVLATGLSKSSVACSSTPGQCSTAPTVVQLEAGTFALPALTSGQFYEITVVASVSATSGSVTNTATIAVPSGFSDPTSSNNSASDTDTVNPVADLAITKTDGVSSLNAGSGSTTYTIRVTNNGPSSVTGAILNDAAATGLSKTSVACSSTPGQCSTAPTVAQLEGGTFALPNLASGQFYEITLTVSVIATTGSVTNTATIAVPSGTTDPTSSNNFASDTDTVNPVADLAITKTDSVASVNAGGSTTYTLRVTNNGPSSVTGAILSDPATTGLSKTSVACSATPGQCVTAPTVAQLEAGTFTLPSLTSGQFYEITLTASVTATTGSVANTATIAVPSGTTDPTSSNNSASDTDTVNPVADLAISKTNGVSSINAGGSTIYTIRVSNNGPSAVSGAILSDPVATGLSKTSVACSTTPGQCSTAPTVTQLQAGTFALPNLASGQFYEISLTTSITATTGSVTNTATIAVPSGTTDPTSSNNSASDTDTVNPVADLAITKTDSSTTAVPGSSISYTITVTNNGPSAVSGATVTDTLPATITGATWTCTASSGSSCTASGSGNISTSVNLLSGGTATYTLTGTVASTATGTLSNTASVSVPSGTTDPTSSNDSAADSDTLTPQADLAISKTDSSTTAIPGNSVSYSITVTNNGPSFVTGAVIADTLPATISGATWTCVASSGSSCAAASGTGNISTTANLAVGGTATYALSGTVSASATGILANTATVAAPSGTTDPSAGNNSATDSDTLTPQADLLISKTDGLSSVNAGSSTTYTIRVTNNGPSNVTGAILTDSAATGLSKTSVSCSTTPGQCSTAPSVAGLEAGTFALPVVAPGQFYEITVNTSVTATTGSVTNTATITAPSGITDPTSSNNSASDTDTINQIADLAISKTDGATTEIPGTSVSYTITVTNNGPSAVSGATVTDTLPATITGATWTCSASSGSSCTASGSGNISTSVNLLSGGTATFTLTGSILTAATGTLTNTASVSAPSGTTDPTPGNNSASDSDTLNPTVNLSISKTDSKTTILQGDSNQYTLTVSNSGPSNLVGATLSDTLPSSLIGVSWTCVASSGSSCTASGSGNISDTVNIPSGGSLSYTVNATVSSSASGTISNTVSVAMPSGTTNSGASSATDTTNILTLSATKSVSSSTPILPGTTLTYTVTITNTSSVALSGATFTDALPSGTSYYPLSATLNGTAISGSYPFASVYSINSPSAAAGTLAAGASATIIYKVVVNSTTPPSTVSNQGTVKFSGGPTAGVLTDDPSTVTAFDPTVSTITTPATLFLNYEDGSNGSYNCVTNSDMAVGGIDSSGTAFGRSQANAPMNGLVQLVSGQLSSTTQNAFSESPWMQFGVSGYSNVISFRHKINNLTTTNVRMTVSIIEAGTNLETTLYTYTYLAADVGVTKSASLSVSQTGVYKVRIRFLGTSGSGSSRGAIDDFIVGAPQATVASGTLAAPVSGASCNYVVDPVIVKAGPASVTQFNAVNYTLTATNNGPATFQGSISDTVPSSLTSVTWTCVSSGDADCDSGASGTGSSGSGNAISLTNVRVRPGSGNSVVITVTTTATTAGSITNTATLTLPSGATDNVNTADNTSSVTTTIVLAGVTVSGYIYSDSQPNFVRDPSEDWASGSTIRVNLVQGGAVVKTTTVNAGTGSYSFSTVVAGSYSIIVTNSATAITAVVPSGWLFITPSSGSLSIMVATSDLIENNFGLFNGSKVSGTVFRDDGRSSGTPNDALQNGGEAGVSSLTITASDGSNTLTTQTDTSGAFSFYVPATFGSTLTLSHTQNPATGTNVAGASVVLATAFNNLAARSRSLSGFTAGQTYSGYNFGIVYTSTLRIDQSGQTTSPGTISYVHRFRPGTLGTVSLSLNSGVFSYALRRDVDCDNTFDTSETYQALSQTFDVDSIWPTDPDGRLSECNLEIRVSVPAGKPGGMVDIAQLQAELQWNRPVVSPAIKDTRTVIDITTILTQGSLRLDKQARNVTQGSSFDILTEGKPGDILEYCIAYSNLGTQSILSMIMTDPIPFFTRYQRGSLIWNSTSLTDSSDSDAGELVSSAFVQVRIGDLTAGQNGEVCYRVTVR